MLASRRGFIGSLLAAPFVAKAAQSVPVVLTRGPSSGGYTDLDGVRHYLRSQQWCITEQWEAFFKAQSYTIKLRDSEGAGSHG